MNDVDVRGSGCDTSSRVSGIAQDAFDHASKRQCRTCTGGHDVVVYLHVQSGAEEPYPRWRATIRHCAGPDNHIELYERRGDDSKDRARLVAQMRKNFEKNGTSVVASLDYTTGKPIKGLPLAKLEP